jgi:hypothetical protein
MVDHNNLTDFESGLIQAFDNIAGQIKRLGTNDAMTSFGAVEPLAMEIKNGSERIADALCSIAYAINEDQWKGKSK